MSAFTPLILTSDRLEVTLLPQGASLVGLRFRDQARNLVLGFSDPTDHAMVPIYAGALVGPVANRISNGIVDIAGQSYEMPRNEAGRTALHSGPDGLHARQWRVEKQTVNAVRFVIILPDGACGLPGNREISATYSVEQDRLSLVINARTDQTTPINIAAHPYWNLDGTRDLSAHHLTVHANRYLPLDEQALPSGMIARTAETAFDFQHPRLVPLTPDLDVNFCLSEQMDRDVTPAATLFGGDGTQLNLSTNAPGLQVYNGSFLPNLPNALTENRSLHPYGAIALEPHHWPDAPRNPSFPSILLYPGEIYHQITEYRLTPP